MKVRTVEDLILKELAASGQGAFLPRQSSYYIMVYYQSDDYKLCEKWRKFFRGEVHPTMTHTGKVSEIGQARGEYMWLLKGEEAYQFCRKIEPWLAQHDQYRYDFCQRCKMEHMSREGHQHR
jgi:hypothetical protein